MKRFLCRPFASAAGLSLAFLLLAGCGTVPRVMSPGSFSTVVIDAGHGGHDSGERPPGRQAEKDLALDTALRLEPLLREAGLKTVLTRSDDTFVELDDRVAIADRYGPDAILVSIHYNASPSSGPRGIETYFWRSDSLGLATRVQRNILSETGQTNHGVIRRVLRLTHNPQEPSILCECGYLTNSYDYSLATTEAYRQRVAEGIADGIVEQHEHGDNDLAKLPPVVSYAPTRHAYRRHHVHVSRHHQTTSRKSSRSSKSSKSSKSKKTTAKKKKKRS